MAPAQVCADDVEIDDSSRLYVPGHECIGKVHAELNYDPKSPDEAVERALGLMKIDAARLHATVVGQLSADFDMDRNRLGVAGHAWRPRPESHPFMDAFSAWRAGLP
jgi:hypothetical protein